MEQALRLLTDGELELEGRLLGASNMTLRAEISLDGVTARCVYKPVRGERPLWDFPDGTLAGREVAAYLVSEAAGWGVVPPTVLRDGPLGAGGVPAVDGRVRRRASRGWASSRPTSCRRAGCGWPRREDEDGGAYLLAHADDAELARLAVFDAVVNNADRKGGHVLHTADRLYGVDHGVCFHVEDKLRTVLWGWVGRPLPERGGAAAGCAGDLAGPLGRAAGRAAPAGGGRGDRGPDRPAARRGRLPAAGAGLAGGAVAADVRPPVAAVDAVRRVPAVNGL